MTAVADRQHLSTDQLLAQLVDAKMRQRQHQKAVATIYQSCQVLLSGHCWKCIYFRSNWKLLKSKTWTSSFSITRTYNYLITLWELHSYRWLKIGMVELQQLLPLNYQWLSGGQRSVRLYCETYLSRIRNNQTTVFKKVFFIIGSS